MLDYIFHMKVNVALQSWNKISYTFYPGRYIFGVEGDSCGSSLKLFHHRNEQWELTCFPARGQLAGASSLGHRKLFRRSMNPYSHTKINSSQQYRVHILSIVHLYWLHNQYATKMLTKKVLVSSACLQEAPDWYLHPCAVPESLAPKNKGYDLQ